MTLDLRHRLHALVVFKLYQKSYGFFKGNFEQKTFFGRKNSFSFYLWITL